MSRSARNMVGHFESASFGLRAYLQIRWLVCPFDRVLDFIPDEGRLLDVGCGSGLWLSYVALERPRMRLEGIDPDPRKLALAATSIAGDFELHEGLAEDLPEGVYDCVTILDVLYLMPEEEKLAVLAACHRALKPGGLLVVKELDTRPWWKFIPSALEELVAVRLVNLTHGSRLHFQSVDDLADAVFEVGFAEIEILPVDEGYMHPHVIVSAMKGAGAEA